MKQTTIVNIYNFVRMSHVEPSRFLVDDFETIRSEIILVKQYGFPGTYALKYDALMDPRYQALFRTYLDGRDEISAWWEITEPLCRRAGVPFRGKVSTEYDDRVDSAYCVGYEPEERKRLVDAYMRDFYGVYGQYPRTIGSWVLDSVTLGYAAERYGVLGGAICRDQMGTDGFTLWGGFPNGIYYPAGKMNSSPPKPWRSSFRRPCSAFLARIPSTTSSRMCGRASRGCIPWNPLGSQGGIPNGWPGSSAASVKSRAWGSPMPMWDRRITSCGRTSAPVWVPSWRCCGSLRTGEPSGWRPWRTLPPGSGAGMSGLRP